MPSGFHGPSFSARACKFRNSMNLFKNIYFCSHILHLSSLALLFSHSGRTLTEPLKHTQNSPLTLLVQVGCLPKCIAITSNYWYFELSMALRDSSVEFSIVLKDSRQSLLLSALAAVGQGNALYRIQKSVSKCSKKD